MTPLILAIDQGTTGTTALLLDADGRTVGLATREVPQHYPEPGWVEHEPEELWASVVGAVREALALAGCNGDRVGAIGLTNQRETTLLWWRSTGKPIGRAIVWQDRRTAARCRELQLMRVGDGSGADLVRARTGLRIDPYFSATKIEWLLEAHGLRAEATRGELCFGTIDSFLVHRLAGGVAANAPHVTDVTNGSRTGLMHLEQRRWDDDLLELFRVPRAMLPRLVPCAGVVARTRGLLDLPDGIPIAGIAGDQHAALFGQACFEAGSAKCTYGTGAFLLVSTGPQPVWSRFGLLTTLGFEVGGRVVYALEGSCFIAGAAVSWLRDGLGLLRTASEVESLAAQVPDSGGVVFVPALSGLGAPHWDAEARGLICGLTRGTTAAHLARATLEAIAHQVDDLLQAVAADRGEPLKRLRVDGGAVDNSLLMQLQADISGIAVERPAERESTARGAALLAGVGAGLLPNLLEAGFQSDSNAPGLSPVERRFAPVLSDDQRRLLRSRWATAVARARSTLAEGAASA